MEETDGGQWGVSYNCIRYILSRETRTRGPDNDELGGKKVIVSVIPEVSSHISASDDSQGWMTTRLSDSSLAVTNDFIAPEQVEMAEVLPRKIAQSR
jgi:hypothetical protein